MCVCVCVRVRARPACATFVPSAEALMASPCLRHSPALHASNRICSPKTRPELRKVHDPVQLGCTTGFIWFLAGVTKSLAASKVCSIFTHVCNPCSRGQSCRCRIDSLCNFRWRSRLANVSASCLKLSQARQQQHTVNMPVPMMLVCCTQACRNNACLADPVHHWHFAGVWTQVGGVLCFET